MFSWRDADFRIRARTIATVKAETGGCCGGRAKGDRVGEAEVGGKECGQTEGEQVGGRQGGGLAGERKGAWREVYRRRTRLGSGVRN